jgi:hypothetical protein
LTLRLWRSLNPQLAHRTKHDEVTSTDQLMS